MNLNNLTPAEGSVKPKRRIARGYGSGSGRTAGRGHKGDKARSGYKRKKGFEGGQMPIQRRVPKKGFKNINREEYAPINLEKVQAMVDKYNITEFSPADLSRFGICAKTDKIKLLARGEIKTAVTLNIHAASESAKSAIEKAGGKINLI